MSAGDLCSALLDGKCRPRRLQRVIGVVAADVEGRHQRVANDAIHLAAESLHHRRDGTGEVFIEHRRDFLWSVRLREARETLQVGEEDADLACTLGGLLQVETCEALLVPLTVGRRGHEGESRQHQEVPFPPARMPIAAYRYRNCGFGQ